MKAIRIANQDSKIQFIIICNVLDNGQVAVLTTKHKGENGEQHYATLSKDDKGIHFRQTGKKGIFFNNEEELEDFIFEDYWELAFAIN